MQQEPDGTAGRGSFSPPCVRIKERTSSWPGVDLRRPSSQILPTERIWPKAAPGTSWPSLKKRSLSEFSKPTKTTHNEGEAIPPKEREMLKGRRDGGWVINQQGLGVDRTASTFDPAACEASYSPSPSLLWDGGNGKPNSKSCLELYI